MTFTCMTFTYMSFSYMTFTKVTITVNMKAIYNAQYSFQELSSRKVLGLYVSMKDQV